jgi:ABC-type sugar transport system substrate-binding protein
MKKVGLLFACMLVLLSSVGLAACSGTEAVSEEDGIKIGFSVIDISMGYWTEQVEGAQAKADELGIELIVQNSDSDAASQISAMEDWVSQGVDAIIVSAVDSQALESYVEAAHEKGIYVIAAIHDLEGADAFVDQDEYKLGVMTGEMAVNGSTIIWNRTPNLPSSVLMVRARHHPGDGMEDGVKENAPTPWKLRGRIATV